MRTPLLFTLRGVSNPAGWLCALAIYLKMLQVSKHLQRTSCAQLITHVLFRQPTDLGTQISALLYITLVRST